MALHQTNYGESALARELGVSQSTVSRKLKQGMTMDQIRAQFSAPVKGRVYVPTRRVSKPLVSSTVPASPARTGPGPAVVDKLASSVVVPVEEQAEEQARERVSRRRKMGKGVDARLAAEMDPDPSAAPPVTVNGETYTQAELRLKIAQANEREVRTAQLREALVNREQINYCIGSAHVKFRDVLFRIPDERSDALMMEDDPVKFKEMLMEALVQACNQLRLLTAGIPGELAAQVQGGETESMEKEPDAE